jgi:membrane associated rhomboid family serine protease
MGMRTRLINNGGALSSSLATGSSSARLLLSRSAARLLALGAGAASSSPLRPRALALAAVVAAAAGAGGAAAGEGDARPSSSSWPHLSGGRGKEQREKQPHEQQGGGDADADADGAASPDVDPPRPARKNSKPKGPFDFGSPLRRCTDAILVVTALVFAAQWLTRDAITVWGAKVNSLIWPGGQLWRLLTPALLHSGALHLLVNAHALHTLGPHLEAVAGGGRLCATYAVSAVTGTALSAVLTPAPSVGASGESRVKRERERERERGPLRFLPRRRAPVALFVFGPPPALACPTTQNPKPQTPTTNHHQQQQQPQPTTNNHHKTPPNHQTTASIFGVGAALAVFYQRHRERLGAHAEGALRSLGLALLVNAAFALANRRVDTWGHAGGALGGALTAWLLGPRLVVVGAAAASADGGGGGGGGRGRGGGGGGGLRGRGRAVEVLEDRPPLPWLAGKGRAVVWAGGGVPAAGMRRSSGEGRGGAGGKAA